jgi:FkbM family methyltransferase
MYSQNDEERHILGHLGGTVGSFLDIGAYDGKMFSNTLALAELGWSGVCVEASPVVFPSLLKLHGNNPKIKLLMAAVDAEPNSRVLTWFDSGGDAVSTTEVGHADRWTRGSAVKFSQFNVFTMPVVQLLAAFGYNHEFINIDVESTNFALFMAIPWESLINTKLVCVEHDGNVYKIEARLSGLGYRILAVNGENIILGR